MSFELLVIKLTMTGFFEKIFKLSLLKIMHTKYSLAYRDNTNKGSNWKLIITTIMNVYLIIL